MGEVILFDKAKKKKKEFNSNKKNSKMTEEKTTSEGSRILFPFFYDQIHEYNVTCKHVYMPIRLFADIFICIYDYKSTSLHDYRISCLHDYKSICLQVCISV